MRAQENDPILLIEPDEAARNAIAALLGERGHRPLAVASIAEGEKILAKELIEVVILDLVFSEESGLALIRAGAERHPRVDFVVLANEKSLEGALEAIRLGAADFLEKPVDPRKLDMVLQKLACRRARKREIRDLRKRLEDLGSFGPLTGRSKPMREIYRTIEKVAPTEAPVLITGESGAEKETVARAIHELSRRKDGAFVAVNCGAIAPALIESELFGHERGAFTGAVEPREGGLEVSRGGTLFLDEITEISLDLQTKLLRAIETSAFLRAGKRREIETGARLIAAISREPAEAVRQGKLRQDLHDRLNVFKIHVPPLRERQEDIALLAQHILDRIEEKERRGVHAIESAAMEALMGYCWPGNVRELWNVISSAYLFAERGRISLDCLPEPFRQPQANRQGVIDLPVAGALRENEKRLILACLRHTQGDRRRAAEILGVSLKTLYNKLNRYKRAAEPPS